MNLGTELLFFVSALGAPIHFQEQVFECQKQAFALLEI
jgi:hypothetical protein